MVNQPSGGPTIVTQPSGLTGIGDEGPVGATKHNANVTWLFKPATYPFGTPAVNLTDTVMIDQGVGVVAASIAQIGSTVTGNLFSVSVTDAAPGSVQTNYSPVGFGPKTRRILVTATSGGTTLDGLNSVGFADGAVVCLVNVSSANAISLAHLSGSAPAGSQFNCPSGATYTVNPFQKVFLTFVAGVGWFV